MDHRAREMTDREQKLENWLPVTASRKAKWWYSAFHNVTAMVGAGVLGLPFAMAQLGWVAGVVALVLSWLITLYSLWQLVQLHESVPGRRFDRYHELGQYVFGPRLGLFIVVPLQVAVMVSSNIVYNVTGGKSLKKFLDLLVPSAVSVRQSYFVLFFSFLQMVLSQIPNFNSLRGVSLLAACMSICYSVIAFVASLIRGRGNEVSYSPRSSTPGGITFDVFTALGTIGFAYAGHSVVLEIQATIPSTTEKPSTRPMWLGVIIAYLVVAICYFTVAITGYWAFGNVVEDDVLVSLEKPAWLIGIANFMVFLHVVGSYQVFAMPWFDLLESYLVRKAKFTPGTALRLIARTVYVAAVGIVAICVPFFGGLLGFFGGLFFAPTSYFVPCIMWIIVQKPKIFSFHWCASWISIFLGVSLMIFSPIGGLREIILSASSYKFFS